MNEQNQSVPPPVTSVVGPVKNVGMAVVAYIIFFIPLLTDAKNDPFVRYHVRQGFVLFLCGVGNMILSSIPVIGMLSIVVGIVLLVLFIMGIMNAVGGKEVELPIVGKYAHQFQI